jgi:hypothetical protein
VRREGPETDQRSNPRSYAKPVIERRTASRAPKTNDGDRALRRVTRSAVSGLLDLWGWQRGSDGQGPAEICMGPPTTGDDCWSGLLLRSLR